MTFYMSNILYGSGSSCVDYYYYRSMALWILSGTTQMSWYQKGKTTVDLLEQEIVSGSGISWAIYKSAHHPRQIAAPASDHSVFTGRMPSLSPGKQHQSTGGQRVKDQGHTVTKTVMVVWLLVKYASAAVCCCCWCGMLMSHDCLGF